MYRIHAEQRGGRVIAVPRLGRDDGWAMDLPAVRAGGSRGDARLGLQPEQPDRPRRTRRRGRAPARGHRGRRRRGRPAGARRRRRRGVQRVQRRDRSSGCGRATRTSSWSARPPRRTRWRACGSASRSRDRRHDRAGSPRTGRPGRSARSPRTAVTAALRDEPGMRANVERVRARASAAGRRARGRRLAPAAVGHQLRAARPRHAGARGGGRARADGPRPRPADVRARPPARLLPPRHGPRSRRGRPPDRRRRRDRPDPAPVPPRWRHARMTTPLGTLDVQARAARRVAGRSQDPRDRHRRSRSTSTARAPRRSRPAIGFYDHLLASLAHHGLFDLEIAATGDLHVDEHHTVEDVALVLGSAFAEALGDRAGIRRFGDSSVPMDESRRDGGHRRRRPAVRRDRPPVPRRACRRRCRSSSSSTRWRRSPGPRARPSTSAAPAATTTTSPRPRSRRSARALRVACEPDPRRTGVASTKGSLG